MHHLKTHKNELIDTSGSMSIHSRLTQTSQDCQMEDTIVDQQRQKGVDVFESILLGIGLIGTLYVSNLAI